MRLGLLFGYLIFGVHVAYFIFRLILSEYSQDLFFASSIRTNQAWGFYVFLWVSAFAVMATTYFSTPKISLTPRSLPSFSASPWATGIAFVATVVLATYFYYRNSGGLGGGTRNLREVGVGTVELATYTATTVYCAMAAITLNSTLSRPWKFALWLTPLTALPQGRFEVVALYGAMGVGLWVKGAIRGHSLIWIVIAGVIVGILAHMLRTILTILTLGGDLHSIDTYMLRAIDAFFSFIDAGIWLVSHPHQVLGGGCSVCNGLLYAIPASSVGAEVLTVGQKMAAAMSIYGGNDNVGVPPSGVAVVFDEMGFLGVVVFSACIGVLLKILDNALNQNMRSQGLTLVSGLALFSIGPLFLFFIGALDMSVAYFVRYWVIVTAVWAVAVTIRPLSRPNEHF